MDSQSEGVDEIVRTDVLIIGGAAAGMPAAIEAAKYGVDVALIDKGRVGFCGSAVASDGETAAIHHPDDSEEIYLKDTLEGGGYLGVRELAETVVREGNQAVDKLEIYGVPYWRGSDGKLKLWREWSFSYPRTPYVRGGGPAYTLALRKEALHRGVKFYEKMMVHELLVDGDSAYGCLAINTVNGKSILFQAKSVVLAAGGATDLYPYTSAGSTRTTGDGYWLDWNAGLEFINMEFVSFTRIPAPHGIPMPSAGLAHLFISGAKYYNALGERFLKGREGSDPERKDRLQRSEMFYSFYREIKEGRGPIYMDATEISEERYYELEHVLNSNILERLRAVGVNPKKERFQWIAPAVHDFLGGARIDANCQTSIPGLYVAGESAGGIYGATRCGDYLTACAVFGFRAGKNAAEEALRTSLREAPWKKVGSKLDEVRKIGEKREGEEPESVRKNIKEIAGKYLSIEREEEGLKEAVKQFERIMGEEIYRVRVKDVEDHIKALELRNLSLTGRLIAEAALRRRETRGHHHRTDYPKSDDAWLKWIILKKDGDKVKVRYEDIPYKIP